METVESEETCLCWNDEEKYRRGEKAIRAFKSKENGTLNCVNTKNMTTKHRQDARNLMIQVDGTNKVKYLTEMPRRLMRKSNSKFFKSRKLFG